MSRFTKCEISRRRPGIGSNAYVAILLSTIFLVSMLSINSTMAFGYHTSPNEQETRVAAGASNTTSVNNPDYEAPEWDQFHGDSAHSGASIYEGPTTATEIWNESVGGSDDGIISVQHEIIISEFGDGINSYSETTGATGVSFATGGSSGTSYPAGGEGEIFFEGYSCGFFTCNIGLTGDYVSTGQEAVSSSIPGASTSSQYYGDGLVAYDQGYVVEAPFEADEIQGFLSASGAPQWTANLGASVDAIPTIGAGLVVVGYSNSDNLTALSLSNGSVAWNFLSGGTVDVSPAFEGGTFYFGTTGGDFFAVSQTGAKIWTATIGSPIETTASIAYGMVIFGADNGNLYALNATTGALVWTFNAGAEILSSPAVSSNAMIYVASTNGTLYGLGLTGERDWSYDIGAAVTASLVLDNGYLFVLDQSGILTAFATTYAVSFQETGLQPGTTWGVTVDSTYLTGVSPITFYLQNGTYSYAVTHANVFKPVPASGSFQVKGSNKTIDISFVRDAFNVTFNETGLGLGTLWNVTLGAAVENSTTSSIIFQNVTEGVYQFDVGSLIGYASSPSSGSLEVTQRNVNQTISFGPGWTLASPPLNVTATGSIGSIIVQWSAPTSSGAPPGFSGLGIEYYYIYRGTTSGSETYYDKVPGSDLSYTDNSVTAGGIYFYEVAAVNPIGTSALSTETSAQAVFLTIPAMVQNFTAIPDVSGDGIYLSWTAPTNDGGSQITGYILSRGSAPNQIVSIKSLPANATYYRDSTNLSPGSTYFYTIVAVNSQGQSNPTPIVQVVAPQTAKECPIYSPCNSLFFQFLSVALSLVISILTLVLVVYARRQRRENRASRMAE